jgi:hypothetical protein
MKTDSSKRRGRSTAEMKPTALQEARQGGAPER